MDTRIRLKSLSKIPMLGLGTSGLPKGKEAGDKRASEIISFAMSRGYTLFDTATAYGNHEEVAAAIREHRDRGDYFICTKINDGDLDNKMSESPKPLREVINKILKELRITYIDCLFIHSPGIMQVYPDLNIIEELQLLKGHDKIRSIGVSNFGLEHFALPQIKDRLAHIDICQIELNPYCQQQEVVEFCRNNNIALMAYRPFGNNSAELLADPVLQEIAKSHGRTVAQVILRWSFQMGFVSIPKTESREHLEDNMKIFNFELTPENMAAIKKLDKNLQTCDWRPFVSERKIARNNLFAPVVDNKRDSIEEKEVLTSTSTPEFASTPTLY